MSDIFEEVDEALQQEKMAALWKEYGSTIILALIVLIASTAATTFYKSWDASRDAEETGRLISTLEQSKPTTALIEIASDTRANHAAIGYLSTAQLYIEENKKDEAAQIYKQIIDEKIGSKNLRNLARIYYTKHASAPSIKVLKPLLADDKSPWIWHARLEASVIAAESEGDINQALDYLAPFKDAFSIAPSLKQRADALTHVYTLKQKNQAQQTTSQSKSPKS